MLLKGKHSKHVFLWVSEWVREREKRKTERMTLDYKSLPAQRQMACSRRLGSPGRAPSRMLVDCLRCFPCSITVRSPSCLQSVLFGCSGGTESRPRTAGSFRSPACCLSPRSIEHGESRRTRRTVLCQAARLAAVHGRAFCTAPTSRRRPRCPRDLSVPYVTWHQLHWLTMRACAVWSASIDYCRQCHLHNMRRVYLQNDKCLIETRGLITKWVNNRLQTDIRAATVHIGRHHDTKYARTNLYERWLVTRVSFRRDDNRERERERDNTRYTIAPLGALNRTLVDTIESIISNRWK